MIEQQGKSEGGKEPPSRSINQIFELFQSSKICLSGASSAFRQRKARSSGPDSVACRMRRKITLATQPNSDT